MLTILMDSLESTKKRALRILGSRNFSEQEMIKRLTAKGETQEDAEEAVRWLAGLGYINDSDYAAMIVRHYSGKGYGTARIKDELFRRGIPRDLWDEKLTELDGETQSDAAIVFLRKKLRGSEDESDLRRAANALVRRGFSYNEANTALQRYLECPEE